VLGDIEGAISDLQTAKNNYRERMGEGNLDQSLHQQILEEIEKIK